MFHQVARISTPQISNVISPIPSNPLKTESCWNALFELKHVFKTNLNPSNRFIDLFYSKVLYSNFFLIYSSFPCVQKYWLLNYMYIKILYLNNKVYINLKFLSELLLLWSRDNTYKYFYIWRKINVCVVVFQSYTNHNRLYNDMYLHSFFIKYSRNIRLKMFAWQKQKESHSKDIKTLNNETFEKTFLFKE